MKDCPGNFKNGFTVTELMIVIAVLSLVLGIIYSTYTSAQKAYRKGETTIELNQNGRVILERLTREIRQAKEIVTDLPVLEANATDTIEFEDGHNLSYVHYIKYSFDNSEKTVKREVKAYYHSVSGDPNATSTYVEWDSFILGDPLASTTIEAAEIIGEYISDLNFWNSANINMSLYLSKDDKTLQLRSKVFVRNI